MANRNSKNKSGNNLQNFLKKKSSKLQKVGRQREEAEKETALKKKRRSEKKILLDSVMKRPTDTVSTLVLQNFQKNVSQSDTNLKETTMRKTSDSEKDTLVDFLEKHSSLQTSSLPQDTSTAPEQKEIHTVKNLQTEQPYDDREKGASEKRESQEKWIQGLIKNAIDEQKKWTKGLINEIKKELNKSEKKQKESVKLLVKNIVDEYMQLIEKQITKASERRLTNREEEPKRTVIKKSLKKTVPKGRKEKIVKKVTPMSKKSTLKKKKR